MLKIKREIYDEMIKYCFQCIPNEACGILAGDDWVTEIYKIKNIESSPVSYFMDPVEQLKAMKDIRKKKIEMVAIFHSHPLGGFYPSQKDIELSFYDVYNVIVCLEPELVVKCFYIMDEKIKEVDIITD